MRMLLALLFSFTASTIYAADAPVSFIKDVAPILKESCYACHDAKKKSGKYDMSTFEKMMAGGSGGEQIVAGKPEDSDFHELMITKEERRMPPRDKGEPVAKAKADIVGKWIKEGAKLDAGIDPKADLVKEMRKRWQPPVPPATYKFPVPINAMAFTPDGAKLVVGGQHELLVWNLKGPKLEMRIRTRSERAHAMLFLPDGNLVVAGGRPGQEGDVKVYNLNAKPEKTDNGVAYLNGVSDTNVVVKQIHEAEDVVLCLALSADGKKLAAGGTDRISRVWNMPEGTPYQNAENNADWVLGLAFTADGKYLLSAGRDRTAKTWDLTKKDSIQTFPDHQVAVYGVAAKPDGLQAYSVGADRQVRAWKPGGDAKQIRASAAHGDEVYKIAFSPKDSLFATAGADKTVRLWDPEKLSNIRTLNGATDVIYALAFSPDGTQLAAGGYDGIVFVWTAKDGKAVLNFNAAPTGTAAQ